MAACEAWKITPLDAVELASACLGCVTSDLLEEERDTGLDTLVAETADPIEIQGPVSPPTLPASDHPVNSRERNTQGAEKGSSTALGDSLTLRAELRGWNTLGEQKTYGTYVRRVPYRPWMSQPLAPLPVTMPDEASVLVLGVRLEDARGTVLHRNFTTFVVDGEPPLQATLTDGKRVRVARVPATAVRDARWTLKQWTVLGDRKLNGAGSGFFEYRILWPEGLDARDVAEASFLVEASAKRLNGRIATRRRLRRETTCAAAASTIGAGTRIAIP